MKVLVLDGTHKKDGMTNKLVKSLISGIKENNQNVNIEKRDLLNENIKFCLGCGRCTEDKDKIMAKCAINNDVAEEIRNKALDADVIVMATPIYEYCVSSAMKRFLERCLPLVTFKFGPVARATPIKGKVGIVICSSGAPWPLNHLMGITRYPKMILTLACKLFRCQRVEVIMAGGMAISKRVEESWCNKAMVLGQKI